MNARKKQKKLGLERLIAAPETLFYLTLTSRCSLKDRYDPRLGLRIACLLVHLPLLRAGVEVATRNSSELWARGGVDGGLES